MAQSLGCGHKAYHCLSKGGNAGHSSPPPCVITVAPVTGHGGVSWAFDCLLCMHSHTHTLTQAELELKSSEVRILVMHLRGLYLTGCYLVMD